MLRRGTLVQMAMMILMTACAASSSSRRQAALTGQLDVYRPLPLAIPAGAEAQTAYLGPGLYLAGVSDFSRERLRLDLGDQGPTELTLELAESASDFPVDGGSFAFTPAELNLPLIVRGEYLRYTTEPSVRAFDAYCSMPGPPEERCDTRTDADGNSELSCRYVDTRISGHMRTQVTSVGFGEDYVIYFFDPETTDELARFHESKPLRTRRSEQVLSGCIPGSSGFPR